MSVIIEEVSFEKGISEFINFPHDLYADDKFYVPVLYKSLLQNNFFIL